MSSTKPEGRKAIPADRQLRAALIAHGTPPAECGPEVPIAPARGPLEPFMPTAVMVDAKGEERQIETGYRGRSAGRVRDVFDHMMARQSKKDLAANGPLFSPGQIATARDYAALTERLASSGVRGISLEVMAQRGAGGDGGFIDAVIDDANRLRAMHRRIGDGVAMPIRRVRVSRRGRRVAIRSRALVDRVCLAQMTVSEVLAEFGWTKDGRLVRLMVRELAACLDRMQGYR